MGRSGKSSCMRPLNLKRLVSGFGGLAALFGVLLFAAMPVLAGVGLGVTPTFPTSVKAGQTGVAASLQIAWGNTSPNDTHGNNVSNITLTPACGAFVSSADCPSAPADFRDPTIFTLSSSGTGVGCGSTTTFTI